MKQCPRCAAEITSKMKKCDRCGLPLDSVDFSDELEQQEQERAKNREEKKAAKKAKKREAKLAKKQARKEKQERESVSNTDFSQFATNAEKSEAQELPQDNSKKSKKARRKYREEKPQFELDENGEFNIETSDVEIVGEETGKLIEQQQMKNYSIKKARGDYREPKIKWWEIYKLADRSFARRKIKKEVNKAAKIRPDFINKTKLLLLAIFLGWCGSHNFYAKNKKKGWTQLICFGLWTSITFLSMYVTFFQRIAISIGGGAGFVNLVIWFSDIFNIGFNSFKYRLQKEKFIFSMNVKTRAKLGEKYIDLDLYKKPWWVKFKVWCQKKKRNYQEWKHERRQRLIEKEKAKLAKQEEQAKIDAEIARHDEMEDAEIKSQKQAERAKLVVDQKTLNELKSFGEEDTQTLKVSSEDEETTEEVSKASSEKKPSKAKLSIKTKNNKNKNISNKDKK